MGAEQPMAEEEPPILELKKDVSGYHSLWLLGKVWGESLSMTEIMEKKLRVIRGT